jgi:hypothetical protein
MGFELVRKRRAIEPDKRICFAWHLKNLRE